MRLRIKQRELDFSLWPMARSTRRFGLQSRVFASEPWNVIERAVNQDCPSNTKSQALAYLQQARDFYEASKLASVSAAKPLLIYYSLMNVVKTFGLVRDIVSDYGNHHHGLVSDFTAGAAGPAGVHIKTHPTSATKVNLFDLLLKETGGGSFSLQPVYELERVLSQILLGHRLWCDASGSTERFIEIDAIDFRESKKRKEVWLRFDLARTEYIRLGYTQKQIVSRANLTAQWRTVVGENQSDRILRFELLTPTAYNHRSSDVINSVVDDARFTFWRSITISPPFRKYYIHVADPADHVLPQICSVYMVFFYLGSITRYRPQFFDNLIAGDFGAFVQEFIENQPNQWLYMLASEFAKQEVTRAAVV
jgi:hypothetical protein